MQTVITIFAVIVDAIGLVLAILLIGLSPIYCFMYFYFIKKNILLSSTIGFLYLTIAIVFSLMMIFSFFGVAMILGRWG
ncbi:hypothetical protein ACTXMK_10130 [Psychrobacter celer]|uniref:hypothetical protein n=1 Tax=Psychrobacter celer TaxID=306572 RepID=UPI003FD3079E